ncbi:MAG: CBS domain-containing protein [Desulfosoma sp.]
MEIITTHKNVDFDALASVVAAKILYPEAHIVLPRSINANVKAFLSIHKDLFPFMSPLGVPHERVSRLIVVDANRWERLDSMEPLMDRSDLEVHLWDHHPDIGDILPAYGKQNLVGSAATLLVQELERRRAALDPIQATLFLAGIYEDTGHLSFPCTKADDARAAAFLLEVQADLNVIQTALRPGYGPQHKEILSHLLETAQRISMNGHVVCFAKAELNGHVSGLGSVVTMLRDVLSADAAFGIFWDGRRKQSIVIARSGPDSLDVSVLMKPLGGGGRPEAASALVKGTRPEGIENWLRELMAQNGHASIPIFDLMSFPVFTVGPDETVESVHAQLKERGHTGAPVTDGEQLVGVISVRDLIKLERPTQRSAPVKAFMKRDVITIDPHATIPTALRLMVKHDIGRLPVVENGKLIGIVTRSDLMLYYYNLI